jgi:uncharacterized repeat protein (TIGR03803 family)
MKSGSVRPSLNNAFACSFTAEEAGVCPKSDWRKIVLGKISFAKRSATLALLILGVLLGAAWAQTETVLYNFCAQTECTDGANPMAGLVFDQKGNLYGTTNYGGPSSCEGVGCGLVFKLSPKGKETALYNFCSQRDCMDGALPLAGLIFDQKGNLYGTTEAGGAHGYGAVFKLTPEGKEEVLYSFCAHTKAAVCTDGASPHAGVVFDRNGNLYGTTAGGGAHGYGTVFKLTPKGRETVLYSFCAQTNCTDGKYPFAGVVLDQTGNLYGTTISGGVHHPSSCELYGCGVVFKLTPKGKEEVLYSFCAQNNCTDGEYPYAGVVFDQRGNLYGTTVEGGHSDINCGSYGCGVVFKLTSKRKEAVLYSFCAQSNCTDGAAPYAGLVFDKEGSLYGTTTAGGLCGLCGVAFKLTPKGRETVLYSFCAQGNCNDGVIPTAGLTFDQKGNLYGTTVYGGPGGYYNGDGVVFKLTP